MAVRIRRGFASLNWLGIGTLVGLLVVWQLLVSTKIIDYSAIPGPIGIWDGFKYLVGPQGGLSTALGHTLYCVAIAWLIAVVVGGAAGLLIAANATVASWAGSTIDLLRSLPVIALIPVAVLIWGIGSKAEIILGAYAGLWPMLLNTAGGARSVPPRLREVARTLRLTRRATIVKIVMPATGAAMLVGARLALATSLVLCIVAEILELQSGVGYAVNLELAGDEPARMWAYVILIGCLGIALNFVLVRLVRTLFPGVTAASERSQA
jgi:ABC-type nitrate/sulfonate/bicarbonate transport system permease component